MIKIISGVFDNMTTTKWVIAGVIAVVAIVLVVLIVSSIVKHVKRRKAVAIAKDNGVDVVDGVRVSSDDAMLAATSRDVTLCEKDIVLVMGKSYTVDKDGDIIPGKYTIMSADGGAPAFNVRIGTFVREYKHGVDIVLAQGEQITPISHKIVLR